MVVITRAQARQIRDHLVSTMLDREGDNSYSIVLTTAGIDELEDLTSMTDHQVNRLTFTVEQDGTRTTLDLNEGAKNKIKWLIKWLAVYQQQLDHEVTSEEWLALTADGYNDYRRTSQMPFSTNATPNVNPNPSPATNNRANGESLVKIELDAFKRSIKRDATIYPTLREEKDWDSWNRGMQSLARTHDVAEVLDANYKPTDELSTALFDQKQSFMYSVLNRVVLTDMG